jgi:hypothetical protein
LLLLALAFLHRFPLLPVPLLQRLHLGLMLLAELLARVRV